MVDRSYDLCLHRCMEDRDAVMMPCKQGCFRNIQVPYRHANHVAKDGEENAYRKCLANSASFPAISQEDFIASMGISVRSIQMDAEPQRGATRKMSCNSCNELAMHHHMRTWCWRVMVLLASNDFPAKW